MRHPIYEKIMTWWWRLSRPVLMQREGFHFYCTDAVPWYAHRMGRNVLPLIDQAITGDTVFGDVGSSFGFYSLYCSTRVKSVYAYEIDSGRVNDLQNNIDFNEYDNITINKGDLSDCDVIKIDIDGRELEYLQSVDLTKNKFLIIEMNQEKELVRWLTNNNYLFVDKRGHNELWKRNRQE